MNHFFQTGLYRKIYKFDRMARVTVDRVLPKNLTIRYIAALTAVAILAISGQLIIQASLARQTEDQRKLRTLEGQIRDSENLRRAVQSLTFLSTPPERKTQIELVESLVLQFQKNDEFFEKGEN